MERDRSWKDALLRLHVLGWNADDIGSACETLNEACAEGGAHDGQLVGGLRASEVRQLLRSTLSDDEVRSLVGVAAVFALQSSEATALREALYDLDAFAYRYAGHD